MKRFLKRIFWWDAPAQGAFFSLTLLLVGCYVLGSVFLAACALGWLMKPWILLFVVSMWPSHEFWIFSVLLSPLFGYWLFLAFRFYYSTGLRWNRLVIMQGALLWFCLPPILASLFHYSFSPGVLALLSFLSFLIVFLPLVCCGRNWPWAVGGLAALGIGGVLLISLLALEKAAGWWFSPRSMHFDPKKFLSSFPFEFSGQGWIISTGVAFLFLFVWYLLTARLFAGLGRVRFRAMFGLPVLILWGTVVLVYMVFTGMAVYERGVLERRVADLELRFGRPVTAEALGELYFSGKQSDAEFWSRMKQLDWWSGDSSFASVAAACEAEFSAVDRQEFRRQWELRDPEFKAFEQQFAQPLPLMPREYRPRTLTSLSMPNLNMVRDFNRLGLWRIRFALADGRFDEALAVFRRMEQVNRSLLNETSLLGGLCWTAWENLRFCSLELLLESGRFSEAQLRALAAELESAESDVRFIRERSLYSEAVCGLDICDAFADGLWDESGKPLVSLKGLGVYFPQFRWFYLLEKSALAKYYNVADFNRMAPYSSDMTILCGMLSSGLRNSGTRFDRHVTRLRALRGVIAAELWKREHGEYPDSMPSLPEDPFSGKPLQYRKGELERRVTVARFDRESGRWTEGTETRTVPAIQVWSVGTGQIGDGRNKDNIGAFLRLSGDE